MPLWKIGAIEWYASYNSRGFIGGYGKPCPTVHQYVMSRKNHFKQSQNPIYQKINFSCADYQKLEIPENALIYCFDKDTEIMTKDGWKLLKDIDINSDTFLSREPETKKLDYLKATDYISYHYTGKMVQYQGRQIDFCITPDHKVFYNKKAKTPQDGFLFAKDFINKSEDYRFIKAGGIWEGKNPEYFDLCGDEVKFEDLCYLLGIFITDGCINNQDNITISQTKQKNIIIIRELLERMKLQYSEHCYREDEGNVVFYLSRKYIPFFKQFYKKENRRIPQLFKDAKTSCLKRLVDGLLLGDGQENRRIIVPSLNLASDYQEIIYKIGLASNIQIREPKESYYEKEDRIIRGTKPYYIVSILKTEYPPFYKRNVELIDYDDNVYCITLEKWHTVLIRHNGKTLWMGQCDSPYKGVKPYQINPHFNHAKYYEWLREKSKTNPIFISEQEMPDDFNVVWQKEVKRTMDLKGRPTKIERLYFIDRRENNG